MLLKDAASWNANYAPHAFSAGTKCHSSEAIPLTNFKYSGIYARNDRTAKDAITLEALCPENGKCIVVGS